MNAQQLQMVLSMMHDPTFRSRLQNESDRFLQAHNCTMEEIQHILSFDARLFEADSLRSDRILTGLLDIFPISVWSALQPDTFTRMRRFFETSCFTQCCGMAAMCSKSLARIWSPRLGRTLRLWR